MVLVHYWLPVACSQNRYSINSHNVSICCYHYSSRIVYVYTKGGTFLVGVAQVICFEVVDFMDISSIVYLSWTEKRAAFS